MAQLPQAIWSPCSSLCHVQRHSKVAVEMLAWARSGGTREGDSDGGSYRALLHMFSLLGFGDLVQLLNLWYVEQPK